MQQHLSAGDSWAGLLPGLEAVTISKPGTVGSGSPEEELGWAGCSLSAKPSFPDPLPQSTAGSEKSWAVRSCRPKSGRPRASDPRKGHGYRKMWEQVTQAGCRAGVDQDSFALPEVSVEDLVRKVSSLSADEAVGPSVAGALGYLDSRAVAALLKELSKCGRTRRAAQLFDWLRDLPTCHELARLCDVYTYTTAISLCGQQKDLRRALEMMGELRGRGGVCNVHTFSAFMNVCTKCGELQLAVDVFRQMGLEKVAPNVVTYNTLIDVYGKLGEWQKAVEVLEIAKRQGLSPEIRTYNTAIIACNMCNQPQEALKVYQRLLDAGESSTATTCTALISTYSKAKMYQKAFEMYDEMVVRGLERGLITYVALFGACEMAGTWELALKYFRDMEREGCRPNVVIFNSLIGILCHRGEWQTGNEIYKKMISQTTSECKPDITTWTPMLNAYDRAGQWQEVCNLMESVLRSSHRADPAFFYAAIDLLWSTGIAQIQAKALLFFNSTLLKSRAQMAVETIWDNDNLSVLVSPHSVGCAIIALRSWLLETRAQIDENDDYLATSTITLVVGQGRNSKDNAAQCVRNVLAAVFDSVGAPLCPSEQQASHMQCTGYALRLWLQDPDSFALVSALVCCPEQINDPAAFLQLSTERKFVEAYNVVRAFESTHELDYEVMGQDYISRRPQLVDLTCNLGMQLELKDVTIHDAVLLMDRVMSSGAKFQEGIAVPTSVALLHMCAEGVDLVKMNQSSQLREMLQNFPVGAVDELAEQIRVALGQDTAAFSAMRLAMSYVEWMGYDNAPAWCGAASVHIRFLLRRCLVLPNFLNFRPSVIAASIIYYDRYVRGWTPFWPSALARITGHEDLGTPEMSGAIQAIFEMKDLAIATPEMADIALG